MQFLPDQLEMPQVQNAAFDQNQVLGADAALQTSLASGSPLAKLEIEMATENLQLLIQHANNRVSEVAGQNFERSLAANQLIEENFANFSTFQSQVLLLDQDFGRVTHEVLSDLQDLPWHCGRKQSDLDVRW